jgi:hypothetical protein
MEKLPMVKKSSRKPRPTSRKRGAQSPRLKKAEIPVSLPLEAVLSKTTRQDSTGFFLIVGFLLVVAGTLFLPNFRILLIGSFFDQYKFIPYTGIIAGFAILFWTFRRQSSVPPLFDLSRPVAYFWFSFFYLLCFYTRFSHPETPEATFWNDDLVVLDDIRFIIDFGVNHLLFPFGQREPLFPYFTAFLWKLIPNADGVFIDRLSSTLIDMGTCWGFYRLGKELTNRWLGLFLMALYSVGKPMIIYCFFGYGANTCVLSTVWMTYFFFHLMKKPVLRRFVYLGIAMGFGAFTYVPARPWTPYLIGVTWLWVLWSTRLKPKSKPQWFLLMGGMFFCAFVAVFKNGYLPETSRLVAFFTWIPVSLLIVTVLLTTYFKVGANRKIDETAGLIFGWATMALVALLINLPFYLQKGYASHVVESSALHVDGNISLGLGVLAKLLDNVLFYFSSMFIQPIHDSSTYPIVYDSFFDPLPVIGMVVGLAFFLARPSWRRGFILSLIPVGMVPFVLAALPNSARPLTSVVPLLVLSGWGLVYLTRSFVAAVSSKSFRVLAFAVLCFFWVWNAVKSDWSIWHRWMARVSHDVFIFQQADKDWKKYRVMIASSDGKFRSPALTALCDQREVYLWDGPTPLYLEPGETGKDVSLLFWGYDPGKIEDRVRKEFPTAQINTIPLSYYQGDPHFSGDWSDDNDSNFLKRAVIPFADIQGRNSGMIYPVRVPAGYWRRRFYCVDYGWARGLVWWDERVPNLSAPLPKETNHFETARADGELNVSVQGDYDFSGTDSGLDFIILLVDGKKIIHYYPTGHSRIAHARVHLTTGIHSITVETYFQNSLQFPKIVVKPPIGTEFVLGN